MCVCVCVCVYTHTYIYIPDVDSFVQSIQQAWKVVNIFIWREWKVLIPASSLKLLNAHFTSITNSGCVYLNLLLPSCIHFINVY